MTQTPAKPLRKAVFPVAGLGTRFLPATKAIPKEMLTVVDKPVIQHVVEEARDAGLEHFVFVTGRNKGVIEDHFDMAYELETTLRERNKTKELEILQNGLPAAGMTSFTRQQAPLGLGHAAWCARDIVGDEAFALLLPDMLHKAKADGCMAQMVRAYNKTPGNYIAVYEVPDEQTHQYGIVGRGKDVAGGAFEITSMIEKPPQGTAQSNLAISGRYILEPQIFDILKNQKRGAGGEIQLTDAMIELAKTRPFYGVTFDGKIYDCGMKIGFLAANLAYALESRELGPLLKTEIAELLKG
ncbi:MAG: UTP--glucose-1-phosphate uridylyltransferase GalU [Pseudomonadota bacterium]